MAELVRIGELSFRLVQGDRVCVHVSKTGTDTHGCIADFDKERLDTVIDGLMSIREVMKRGQK